MLKHLKVNTATGPDDLPAFLLKNLASEIAPNIQSIINTSIQTGQVPGLWKEAIWENRGSKSDPSSYRPISVLPVLARMKEATRQLTKYLNSKEIIAAQQFGFREKSSCEVALLHSLDNWMGHIDSGSMVGALLIDLSKVFDCWHHRASRPILLSADGQRSFS